MSRDRTTFKIYNSTATTVLAERTATITVPYRPSASAQCSGADAGKWFNSKDGVCYNGFADRVKVKMSKLGVTLPDQVIWSVQYNTSTSGYAPIGAAPCRTESGGCGYDALNVGTFSYPNAPFAGTDVDPAAAFVDGAMKTWRADRRPLGAIATK